MRAIVSIALVACVSVSVAFAADDMTAFPPAEEGMTRHVISLPKQQDESAFKVELIIGKTVKTDATNSYFFGGTLEWTTTSPPPTENFAETPIVTWEAYDYQAPVEHHVA